MFLRLFSNRFFIGVLVLVVCCVGILYFLRTQTPKEPIKIYKPTIVEKPKETEAPVGETSQGHFHADDTFHEGTHEAHQPPFQLPPTEPVIPRGTPFANFTPDPNEDPVTAAYRRLEYIKNNPHEWGDLSPQTLELMDEMTPVPNRGVIKGDGESEIESLEELSALRDPRSAELLLAWQMDSGIKGRPVTEALVAMGPAAVPALLARLDDVDGFLSYPIRVLGQIATENRTALGGIVEYIIIPKFEAIAASTSTYQYYAGKVISELQR